MTAPRALGILPLAEAVMSDVIDWFDAAGVELPVRRVIAPGSPPLIAWDCDQLVVSLVGIGIGQSESTGGDSYKSRGQSQAVNVRHATFSIQLIRCTPSVAVSARNPAASVTPSAEQITDSGLASMQDAGLLSQAIQSFNLKTSAVWAADHDGLCDAGAVVTLGPEGGHHGVEGTFSITSGNLV